MLMVTENAGQAIEAIVANAEMPDGSGLRIDAPDQRRRRPTAAGYRCSWRSPASPPSRTSSPAKATRRCLSHRQRPPILDDKVLDVRVSEDKDRVQFVIGPQ